MSSYFPDLNHAGNLRSPEARVLTRSHKANHPDYVHVLVEKRAHDETSLINQLIAWRTSSFCQVPVTQTETEQRSPMSGIFHDGLRLVCTVPRMGWCWVCFQTGFKRLWILKLGIDNSEISGEESTTILAGALDAIPVDDEWIIKQYLGNIRAGDRQADGQSWLGLEERTPCAKHEISFHIFRHFGKGGCWSATCVVVVVSVCGSLLKWFSGFCVLSCNACFLFLSFLYFGCLELFVLSLYRRDGAVK